MFGREVRKVWVPSDQESGRVFGREGTSPRTGMEAATALVEAGGDVQLSGKGGEGTGLPAKTAVNGVSLQILCHGQAPGRGAPQPKDRTGAPICGLLHPATPHSARGHRS